MQAGSIPDRRWTNGDFRWFSRFVPLAAAGALVLSTASQAAELCPLDAYVVDLGDGSAVVYYTVDQDDLFRVVTTVGTDRETASAGL